jgi:hypothetical protein
MLIEVASDGAVAVDADRDDTLPPTLEHDGREAPSGLPIGVALHEVGHDVLLALFALWREVLRVTLIASPEIASEVHLNDNAVGEEHGPVGEYHVDSLSVGI